MKTIVLCCALLAIPAAAQVRKAGGEEAEAQQKLDELRREQAQNRSRLDRLVELKILMDLGGPVAPEVLASLLPAGSSAGNEELERQLRTQEQRLSAERERFAAARPGAVPPPTSAPADSASAPRTGPQPSKDQTAAGAASRPAESHAPITASRPAETRPQAPAVSIGKSVPSLRAVYILLQEGHTEEARAVLQDFPAGSLPPSLFAFLSAGIAERAGDLQLAERTLIKAMGEETRAGRNKGPQFEAMKLALDHVTWKNNRAGFNKLLAGLDAGKKEK